MSWAGAVLIAPVVLLAMGDADAALWLAGFILAFVGIWYLVEKALEKRP